MTRGYEVVYIFDSTLDETKVDEHLKRFHALLINDDNPDPVKNINHWGKRTLAYPIKRREIGYYVVAQLGTDPTLLGEFERLVKLEEEVLRYQLVLNEGEVPALVVPVVDGQDKDAASDRPDAGSSPDAASDRPDAGSSPEAGSSPDTGSSPDAGGSSDIASGDPGTAEKGQ